MDVNNQKHMYIAAQCAIRDGLVHVIVSTQYVREYARGRQGQPNVALLWPRVLYLASTYLCLLTLGGIQGIVHRYRKNIDQL